MLKTKEHYDLMAQFEANFKHLALAKEDKGDWSRGIIYQNGNTNELFKVYRHGYAYGKAVAV